MVVKNTKSSAGSKGLFRRGAGLHPRRLLKGRRGSALVAAMIFVTVFGMVVGNVLVASNRQTRNTFRSRLYNTSLAAAASVVGAMTEQAFFVATTRPAQLGGNFNKLDEAILSIEPKKLPGYTAVKADNKDLAFMKAKSANNGDFEVIDDATDDWNGFNIARWRYDAVAFLNAGNETSGELDTVAQRLGFEGAGFKADVEINFIPLYQYAIFYDNDLEIHNGPVMNVKGPVHTNRTLWVASGSGLNFYDRVSAAGSLRSYRDFLGVSGSTIGAVNKKNAPIEASDHTADVTLRNGSNQTVKLNNNGTGWGPDSNKNTFLDSKDKNWLSDAMSRFGGKLQDSAMGVKPIKPPLPYVENANGNRQQADAAELIQRASVSDSASMQEAKMEYKADLIIEGDPSKATWDSKKGEYTNISIHDRAGNTYPNTVKVGNKTVSMVTPGSFYDNRQKTLVNTFDVNMGVMNDRSGSLPIKNGNGLLYVSPNGGNMGSVRLTNAASMPSNLRNTMTVATDRPMYLEGDVNSGGENDRATLLLAADSITVTSQRLTADNTKNDAIPAAARNTITNAIFMLGQVASTYDNGTSSYTDGSQRTTMSGGAHNVLRYLENWGGVNHEFNGSLICLFESRVAKGAFWRMDGKTHKDYYNPPNRKYNWDASLKTKEPPAGMPVLVQVKTKRLERINKAEALQLASAQ